MARRFLQRLKSSYKQSPIVLRSFMVALAICVAMAGAYLGLRAVVMRVADHMTVTVSCTQSHDGCVAGEVIFQRTFGWSLTSDAQRRLNGETMPYSSSPYSSRMISGIMVGGLNLHYHLAFSLAGVLVETADVTAESVPEFYIISSLGMQQPGSPIGWGQGQISWARLPRQAAGSFPRRLIPTGDPLPEAERRILANQLIDAPNRRLP